MLLSIPLQIETLTNESVDIKQTIVEKENLTKKLQERIEAAETETTSLRSTNGQLQEQVSSLTEKAGSLQQQVSNQKLMSTKYYRTGARNIKMLVHDSALRMLSCYT